MGLFRRAYAGVNASDVNYTAGRYFGGGAAAEKRLPFDAGFESVGVVAALGPGVSGKCCRSHNCETCMPNTLSDQLDQRVLKRNLSYGAHCVCRGTRVHARARSDPFFVSQFPFDCSSKTRCL